MIVMVYELGKCLFSLEVRATMQVWLLFALLSHVQKEMKEGTNAKAKLFLLLRCLPKMSAGCLNFHHHYKYTFP